MTFHTFYEGIYDAVKAAVETVSSLNQVVCGERFVLQETPCAIINPGEVAIDQQDAGPGLYCGISIEVVLIVRENEPDDWFDEVVEVLGDILDAVIADRGLGGLVLDIAPVRFSPAEIRIQNRLYSGGVVTFMALAVYE
ncbi:hypothetical protein ES707_12217 [subsurface metagenome]